MPHLTFFFFNLTFFLFGGNFRKRSTTQRYGEEKETISTYPKHRTRESTYGTGASWDHQEEV